MRHLFSYKSVILAIEQVADYLVGDFCTYLAQMVYV